jgi:hypothetical protein
LSGGFIRVLKLISMWREDDFFYLDETWIESHLTFEEFWQTDEVKGVLADGNAQNRLTVFHARSEDGFVAGAQLLYKTGLVNGDYDGQINSSNC